MKPENIESFSSRDRLVTALETQIRKQEEIIRTQQDTIRILEEHNNKLTKILSQIFKP